jgi:hypothetical protein
VIQMSRLRLRICTLPSLRIETWGNRELIEDGLGFFAGQAGYVGDGILVGVWVLGDVGGMDPKGEAGLGEELAAAGGCGGQDEHRLIMPWMGGGGYSRGCIKPFRNGVNVPENAGTGYVIENAGEERVGRVCR